MPETPPPSTPCTSDDGHQTPCPGPLSPSIITTEEDPANTNTSQHSGDHTSTSTSTTCCDCIERRWILVSFAFGSICCVAGVVYGWPALRRQLLDEGSTLTEKQLGAVYTAGSWSVQGGRFFTGLLRDRYGTKAVACGSLLCVLGGALGLALCNASNGIGLGVSLFIMSLGAGTQLVMQPVGSLFPTASNAVISTLSGAFQISGLVFLVLLSLPLTRRDAFLLYTGVVALLLVMAYQLLPTSGSFEIKEEKENNSQTMMDEEENIGQQTTICDEEETTSMEKAPQQQQQQQQQPTKFQQICSLEYIGLLIWFSCLLIPLQYYVGSIGFQLESKGDDDGFYTDLFNIVYAAVAVVAPAGGYLSDRIGLGWTQGISTFMVAVSFFILGSDKIPLGAGQSVGIVLYSLGRMLLFGMYFSNIGRRFGFTNFGTLSGVGLLLSAVCSILQYPLIALASEGWAKTVNFVAGSVLLCLLPYCGWLGVMERRHDKAPSLIKKAAEDEE